ncbi:helix-turn-helix transcriptional regulator [Ensifer sp. LC163]|uniref:helix-turn-helix transcriptional regulator n=1 Tax=Ensifer sp. LC163 TaxID=1120652 RepID=UPI0008133B60|nr:response regulator transcription factor [Ensifer sp. LC163]OCP35152.1 helix-turn-helix transcriptional regulator [Ensifer sp. LC163]
MSISSGTVRRKGRNAPTGIVIEPHTLARTAIVTLLERELAGWNFIDMISTASLDRALGMDVRLITLDLAGRGVRSGGLLADLAAVAARFPEAPVALLSDTDDSSIAAQALQMGIRGFFTTSLPIEIALAGLRLVLAGGVFCPHPLGAFTDGATLHVVPEHADREIRRSRADELILADFTPREADVLAELQCGSSNKVIAGKLNLSGHTVKMHLQHIMRKLQVQNRTEVVARLGGRPSSGNGAAVT